MTTQEHLAHLRRNSTRRWRLRVSRCNRWDVYPEPQPIEEYVVQCSKREYVTDALARAYPQWRVSSPVVHSVEDLGIPE